MCRNIAGKQQDVRIETLAEELHYCNNQEKKMGKKGGNRGMVKTLYLQNRIMEDKTEKNK